MSDTASAQPHLGGNVLRQTWTLALIMVATVLTAIAPFFHHEITGAVQVWIGSTAYNHCFLIIPIVIYLCWQRRDLLASLRPVPSPKWLIAILALSGIWLFAAEVDVLELRQFVFLAIVQAVLVTLLGPAVYRRLLGPLLYLFFLVPSGEFLVPTLQDFTARFSVAGLHLLGVPVYSDGTFIEIPEGTFFVAEACAGLRFLVASIAYGVLFALLMYRSWYRRAAFVALSMVVPIVANGLRAFGIIYAAHLIGSAKAATADHILYGWIFFSIVIFLLTLVGMSFSERNVVSGATILATTRASPRRRIPPATYIWVAAACIGTAIIGPSRAIFIHIAAPQAEVASINVPDPVSPWVATDQAPDWQPSTVGAARQLLRSYSDGRHQVARYIALYVSRENDDHLLRSPSSIVDGKTWIRVNSKRSTVRVQNRDFPIVVTDIRSDEGDRLVWSFYVVNGKLVRSAWEAKLRQALAGIFGQRGVAAFIALSTPKTDLPPSPSHVLGEFLISEPSLEDYVTKIH